MRIGIIGSGITGLTIGLRLAQKGHAVTIWESAGQPGGLAAGFKEPHWQWSLEHHYHHLFTSDHSIKKLAKELDVPIKFYTPITSIWYQNQSYPFDNPVDLWKFPHLSMNSKLRTSFWLAYLKYLPVYRSIENYPAREWLIQTMGQPVWRILWEPLFQGKFGQQADRISAAWFWARIHKRSRSLGYFEGGFQTLVTALVKKIHYLNGQILLKSPVTKVQVERNTKIGIVSPARAGIYDRVIIAGPSTMFTQLVNHLPPAYLEKIHWLRSLGAVNLVLALKHQFLTDNTYWLNINDHKLPFLAVVEHTNMVDPQNYGNDHLLYVGNYLPASHPFFQLNEHQLINEFSPHLQTINPQFKPDWIRKAWAFKAPFAQPIVTPHYQDLLPAIQTLIPHLWWVSMQHIYPWDRGTNYAVEWGEKVTKMVLDSI